MLIEVKVPVLAESVPDATLLPRLRARLPEMGDVTCRWSGQVMEPTDYVGFIGRHPDQQGVYLISGDSGQGITNGIVAGTSTGISTNGRSEVTGMGTGSAIHQKTIQLPMARTSLPLPLRRLSGTIR